MAASTSGIIDLPLLERVTLDPGAAFESCFVDDTVNGKTLFARKKDDSSVPKGNNDGSDGHRISNTVAVIGPPSHLKRRVVDLLLSPAPSAQRSPSPDEYVVRNYAAGWSSGIGLSYSKETRLAVLDVPTDGYPHKVALPLLFALSVSQVALIVCSEVCTPSTLPDTSQCALIHGLAKSVSSLKEPHLSKLLALAKERPSLGFVLPHFAPHNSEALLEAWARPAQHTPLFAHDPVLFFRVPLIPSWQAKLQDIVKIPPQARSSNSDSDNTSLLETVFVRDVTRNLLHEQKTGMATAKAWCGHVADVAGALTPSGQNPLGLAVADALKTHVSGALRTSMIICSKAVSEARQLYAEDLPGTGSYSREAHERQVEKAMAHFKSIAAGVAVEEYLTYLRKKLHSE